jgi:hypothetical protein
MYGTSTKELFRSMFNSHMYIRLGHACAINIYFNYLTLRLAIVSISSFNLATFAPHASLATATSSVTSVKTFAYLALQPVSSVTFGSTKSIIPVRFNYLIEA